MRSIKEMDKRLDEREQEIERLNKEKDSWKRVATKNFNEAEDYKAIIKEVRELIKNKWKKDSYWEDVDNCLKYCIFSEFEKEDILEILDKENKE